jgi:UDP:flavonoid glycosyltransferase YjiC (YdhE family)
MRISISTLGTRGDVQPYVALAQGLMRRGHQVQLAAPEQFAGFVTGHGVAFAALPGDFLALLDTPEGKAAVAGGQGFSAGFKLLKHVRPLMRHLLDVEWRTARDFSPDLLVYHPKALAATHIAERLGVPAVLASPLPGFTPTAAFPSPMLPFATLGPLNRVSHQLAIRGGELLFSKLLRAWRRETLDLPERGSGAIPAATLYAYSSHVVPVPRDWGPSVAVTGYWFLDEPRWEPPQALRSFLDAGDKPVYVGFGSMPGLDPDRLASDVIAALAQLGRRGILATGGGALRVENAPPHIHVIDTAPHDQLLPLTSAAVHHGGAGTTASALRAGIPMVICPFLGDQPFWGRRTTELGVAPPQLDRKHLHVDALASAIGATADAGMRERAAQLGALVRVEDGVGAAIGRIEALAR